MRTLENMENPTKNTGKFGPGNSGKPKGATSKVNRELKDMILTALTKAGGVTYLTRQATENPKAFLTLVGKVLPMQVTGDGGGPIQVTEITRRIVKAK